MRPARPCRAAWLTLACLLLAWVPAPLRADTPPPAAAEAAPSDPDAALQAGLDLERHRNWSAAMRAYEEALERWPQRTDFRHRLRLCEIHHRLARRYQDHSFRNVLLRLPSRKAMDLYDEVLERIETHYVEPVSLDPLLRRGLDNLEVALRDPTFLQANAPGASADRVRWLRDAYRQRRAALAVHTRAEARAQVLSACELARQALNMPAAAVILEFSFGACDVLDDYTCYLTPDKLDDLFAMIDGNFVGLGVELKLDEAGLKLVGVIRGGPAAEAQLRVGDKITHVNGSPVRGLSLDEAAGRLQGNEGTPVEITILRNGGEAVSLKLIRRPIEVESVTQSKIVDPALGVGYIQLSGFQKSSTEELDRAIQSLNSQGMRQLILDLRGNPGGLLNVAVEMADRFLDTGVIVTTRGRAPGQTSTYESNTRAVWRMPLIVLIDHDSASASEILAGALKDHRRAVILGERSYGKGSVQSIFPLRTASAGLKLTTAKFYSPRDRAYSEQGVEPDVPVEAHIAARPLGEPDAEAAAIDLGNPERDPVLNAAIRQAQHQYSKAG